MKRVIFCLIMPFLMAFSLLALAHDVREHKILRVSGGVRIDLEEMVEDLSQAQMIFVGERHNEASHHAAQLAVVQALHDAGTELAVGLEMFRSDSQAELDGWVAGKLTEKAFERIYYKNWSTDWALYRDIFLYAREKKLPMIGLNISPEITRQVAAQGFASLTPEQVGQLPPVACDVDAGYMSFIRRAFGLHGHSMDRDFINFCEAQMVWDTAMASHLLAFHEKNPKYTVVVLAGSGHAWKRGIPEQIKRRSKLLYRVILPEVPHRIESTGVAIEDADYLWLGL